MTTEQYIAQMQQQYASAAATPPMMTQSAQHQAPPGPMAGAPSWMHPSAQADVAVQQAHVQVAAAATTAAVAGQTKHPRTLKEFIRRYGDRPAKEAEEARKKTKRERLPPCNALLPQWAIFDNIVAAAPPNPTPQGFRAVNLEQHHDPTDKADTSLDYIFVTGILSYGITDTTKGQKASRKFNADFPITDLVIADMALRSDKNNKSLAAQHHAEWWPLEEWQESELDGRLNSSIHFQKATNAKCGEYPPTFRLRLCQEPEEKGATVTTLFDPKGFQPNFSLLTPGKHTKAPPFVNGTKGCRFEAFIHPKMDYLGDHKTFGRSWEAVYMTLYPANDKKEFQEYHKKRQEEVAREQMAAQMARMAAQGMLPPPQPQPQLQIAAPQPQDPSQAYAKAIPTGFLEAPSSSSSSSSSFGPPQGVPLQPMKIVPFDESKAGGNLTSLGAPPGALAPKKRVEKRKDLAPTAGPAPKKTVASVAAKQQVKKPAAKPVTVKKLVAPPPMVEEEEEEAAQLEAEAEIQENGDGDEDVPDLE